ncbi:YqeG family HAD IIIA-type phosphatase [Anaerosolibacter sp.]|uniref:YqeG family HAD IIIA-type phosphatase n=1 Tax=Anaerosolibacter sp. TaxID=1872527 RepID=UPI0039EE3E6E
MLERLKPKLYVDSIFYLDLEQLKKLNIKGFIIDIDNTLVEWEEKTASDRVKTWLRNLELEGFKVCLVSNNTEDRVVKFNEELKLPTIHRAVKPRVSAFHKAMELMGTTPETTAVIGDQLFTDVLGGNRLNLFTILVIPLGNEELNWTKFVRKIEKVVLKRVLH